MNKLEFLVKLNQHRIQSGMLEKDVFALAGIALLQSQDDREYSNGEIAHAMGEGNIFSILSRLQKAEYLEARLATITLNGTKTRMNLYKLTNRGMKALADIL